ncbi:MAG: PKD domain-containing protein, partial [Bacteroidales bacterium]
MHYIACAQHSADFSIETPYDSCKSRTVRLDASVSSGDIVNYTWEFVSETDNELLGQVSGEKVSKNFLTPGVYEIILTTLAADKSTSTITKKVQVYNIPEVQFAVTPDEGCVPTEVQFTDESNAGDGEIVRWSWSFGDGEEQTFYSRESLSYKYNSPGTFSPTLIVENSFGCVSSYTNLNAVNVYQEITPHFIISNNTSCSDTLTVDFENTSDMTTPFNYVWDFGDGTVLESNDVFLRHHYSQPGEYEVTLTAINETGNCSQSSHTAGARNVIIGKPYRSFTFSPESPICQGERISFSSTIDTTGISNDAWWGISDGSQDKTGESVRYRFNTPGTFAVKYAAFNNYSGCVGDTVVDSITVLPIPTADFNIENPKGCDIPYTVNISNQSEDGTSYRWDFGDGTSAEYSENAADTSHTYSRFGNSRLTLTVQNEAECSDSKTYRYIRIQKPSVDFELFPSNGCVPLPVELSAEALSIDPIDAYVFDYGNGEVDTLTHETSRYVYRNPGVYSVRVGIITKQGCVAYAEPQKVTVKEVCSGGGFGGGGSGGFGGGIDGGWAGDCTNKYTFSFEDTLSHTQLQYWIFNTDTVHTSEKSITYTFPDDLDSNRFLVTSVYYDTILNETKKNQRIVEAVDETANYEPSFVDICKHTTVDFRTIDIDSTYIAEYYWDFGDGEEKTIDNTDNIENEIVPEGGNVQHVYVDSGYYNTKLVITDIRGCTDSLEYPVPVYVKGPRAKFGMDTTNFCYSEFTAHFIDSSEAHGSSDILTWDWEFGDETGVRAKTNESQTHTFTNNSARKNYTARLKVTDTVGCWDYYELDFTAYNPSAAFTTTDTLRCGTANIRMQNRSDAYMASYNDYTWELISEYDVVTKNGYHSTFSLPDTGMYDVRLIVQDAGGCYDTLTKTSVVKSVYPVADFKVGDTSQCVGEFSLPFTSTSLYGEMYTWDFGNGNTTTTSDVTVSQFYEEAGWYDVTLIVDGLDGCTDSITKPIRIKGPRGDIFKDSGYLCLGDTLTVWVEGYNVEAFNWDMGDGASLAEHDRDSLLEYVYEEPGMYKINVILNSPEGCQLTLSLDEIMVDNVDAGPDKHLECKDSYVTLEGTSALNMDRYQWVSLGGDNEDTYSNTSLKPRVSKPGTYVLKVEEQLCNNSDTVVVSSSGIHPDIVAGGDRILDCLFDTITLYADIQTPVDTFYWEGPEDAFVSSQTDMQAEVCDTGMFVLHAQNGTCYNSDTVWVTECTLIPCDTTIWLCANRDSELPTKIEYNLHDADPFVSENESVQVSWYYDSAFVHKVESPSQFDISDSTYLIAKVLSQDGVQRTRATVLFRVRDFVEVSYEESPGICASSGDLQLDAQNPQGGVFSGEYISESGVFSEQNQAGTYTVTYTYTRDDGCVNSVDIPIEVYPLPNTHIVFPIMNRACSQTPIECSVEVSDGADPYVHNWSSDNCAISNPHGATTSFSDSVSSITIDTVFYMVTDSVGCVVRDSAQIIIYPYPEIDIVSFGGFCENRDSIAIDIASPAGGDWYGTGVLAGDTEYVFSPDSADPGVHSLVYEIDNMTAYNLPYGVPECVSYDTIAVEVYALPDISLGAEDDEMCVYDSIQVVAEG